MVDYLNDPGRWSLTDLKQCLDDGEGPLYDLLCRIAETMEKEQSSNFILGRVIIENDLEQDDDEVEIDDPADHEG